MPRVIVYHRFAPPSAKIPSRVSADEFAWQLDTIRRDFRVISLADCIEYYTARGIWPKKSVVLTIDDGYRDMYEWAYPELLKRGLPATFFVTTRFIDGEIWLWPDRLDYTISNTTHNSISISIGNSQTFYPLENEEQKATAWKAFSDYCISICDQKKEGFLKEVERLLEVPLPPSPTPEYSALTWHELREMRQNGIEIGSHTVNHPILSKIDPCFLEKEISTSKQLIEQQLGEKIKSFCYPNSAPDDISDEVVAAVKSAEFCAAVFGRDLSRWEPYRIPRMGISDDRNDFVWKIFGGEFLSLTFGRLANKHF